MNRPSTNDHAQGYRLPPKSVTDIINAPPEPSVIISPDGQKMLQIESDAMPDIADLARPMLRLAGLRIDPHANTLFRAHYRKGLLLQTVTSAAPQDAILSKPQLDPVRVDLGSPAPRIGLVKWSHNSYDFAFTVLTDQGTALYTANIDDLKPRLVHARFSSVLNGLQWMPNGKSLVFSVVPENRTPPSEQAVPTGPRIEESWGNTSPTRHQRAPTRTC